MTSALTRGRITRGGILRGGVAAGGILLSQRQNVSPYAFNLDLSTFKDTVTGQSLSCNIDGTRYDEVNGVTTAFATDVPTIADNGLRICGAYSNYLLNSVFNGAVSGTPGTSPSLWTNQGITGSIEVMSNRIKFLTTSSQRIIDQPISVTANTNYIFSIFVDVEVSTKIENIIRGTLYPSMSTFFWNIDDVKTTSSSTIVPTGTYNIDFILVVGATGGNMRFRIGAGCDVPTTAKITISNPMINLKYAHPYIPTTSATVSSPSEAGNSSTGTGIWIDDVATNFPLLNTALTSQGTLIFKWKTGFADADVSGNLNILSFDGTTTSAISYDADNNLIKITDGTNTASKALTVVADTEYTIQATWGLFSGSPKMAIAVNGTAGSQADFTGIFTHSDIYFGLENEELQYIKDFMVYKVATWL